MKWMINCKEATRLLSDQIERPLSFSEKILLKMHLVMCFACGRYGRQIETLHLLFSQTPDIPVDDDLGMGKTLPDEKRQQIKTLLSSS